MIRLLELMFNHDQASSSQDALNIRVNFDRAVTLPEWRAGASLPEHSPAAYTFEAGQREVTVRARFGRELTDPQSVQIRTLDLTSRNYLGRIGPRRIDFGNQLEVEVQLKLLATRLNEVGRHDDAW